MVKRYNAHETGVGIYGVIDFSVPAPGGQRASDTQPSAELVDRRDNASLQRLQRPAKIRAELDDSGHLSRSEMRLPPQKASQPHEGRAT